jgi:indolepyruvate ferredoxin oxidoreductase
LGCDMLTAGAHDAIAKTRPGRTVAVINTHQQPPGQFTQNPEWQFPAEQIRALIEESVSGRCHFIDATSLATALLGDSIATNLFMLGYAFQKELIPVNEQSILKAIELNGVAIDANKQAFTWGRRAAVSLQQVQAIATPAQPVIMQLPQSLETMIRRRAAFLGDYQNPAYARRYEQLVDRVRQAESRLGAGDALSKAVAKYFFKLMAYKDEYEVARLYTNGQFDKRLKDSFEGDFKVSYNLAPPLFAKRDAHGHLVKARFGPWMKTAFRLLAGLRGLRGTVFDVFGYSAERKLERQLIREYEGLVDEILRSLTPENYQAAVDLAALPERIRGFGHVKQRHIDAVKPERERLLQQLRHGKGVGLAA